MKKVLSVLAVVLFTGTLNANVTEPSNNNEEVDCWSQVEILVIQAETAGKSLEEIEFLSNGALAVFCYGYSWDDVYGR